MLMYIIYDRTCWQPKEVGKTIVPLGQAPWDGRLLSDRSGMSLIDLFSLPFPSFPLLGPQKLTASGFGSNDAFITPALS